MIVFKGGCLSAGGHRTGLRKDFAGLVAYLTRGFRDASNPDRVAWLSSRNLNGADDPARIAQVMRAHAEEHFRTKKPVYHFGLTLPSSEHLSPEQWNQAVDQVLLRLGLDSHQVLVVAHRDTAHEHVHVVVNRVGDDGPTWHRHDDLFKMREAVRSIEIDYGLSRDGDRDPTIPELTTGAYQQALRTGRQPLADRVRDQAVNSFAEATSWSDLEVRLAILGFRLEPAARNAGLLVTDGSRFASLSHVDRSLSGPKLAQRFGETFHDHRQAHPEPPPVLPPGRIYVPPPGDSLEHRAAALLDGLTGTRATFTEADLRRASFYQPESVALVREALRSDRVLDLGKDAGGANRYTTRDYLDAEARLLAAAASLAARDRFRLDPGERATHEVSSGHRAAVLHATTAADLAQVVGGGRADRTAAARTIAAAYQERGYEVRGAALTAKGAAAIESATGVRSRTLATLEHAWSEGAGRLHARSVLLLDEAGLLDVRRLGGVLAEAEERGAKVVLMGDSDRLQAIGAGDAYRGLLELHPSARIDTARVDAASIDATGRQRESRQPAVAEQLAGSGFADRHSVPPRVQGGPVAFPGGPSLPAGGPVASALDRCDDAGRLHWTVTRGAAQAELLAAYARGRRQDPAGSQLILASSYAEVTQLNDAVRAERRAAGELGPGIRVGATELAPGDRIVFLREDHQGIKILNLDAAADRGVRKGTLGTVVAAEPHHLAVRLDDGRTVAFDPARYRAVAHGYAVGVHRSGHANADRVYVLADPRMNRHAAQVALTRHRDSLDLFADRETFPSREHLDKALSRPGHRDLAGDYAAADLRRAVSRLQDLAAKTAAATREERPLRADLAAHASLQEARRRVGESRRSLAQPAAQVYADPVKALRSLLRDPAAPERLRQGEARAYGILRGHALLGAPSRDRAQARQAVASLTGRLDAYQRSLANLQAAKQTYRARTQALVSPSLLPGPTAGQPSRELPTAAAARTPPAGMPRPAQIRRELARVTTTLRTHQQASRSAQDAIETAIRGMGRAAVDSALLLLPPRVAIPVNLAVRAVERDLERGLDLGLGR